MHVGRVVRRGRTRGRITAHAQHGGRTVGSRQVLPACWGRSRMASEPINGSLPGMFMNPGMSSFTDFVGGYMPDLLPGRRAEALGGPTEQLNIPHATTIVAVTFPGGVIMAGDRRATAGNMIAQRDIEKVFPADEYSAVAIAGTAGLGLEMTRQFQVELEHYEKME